MSTSKKYSVTVQSGTASTVSTTAVVPNSGTSSGTGSGTGSGTSYRWNGDLPVEVSTDGVSSLTIDLRGYRYDVTIHDQHHHELLSILRASPAMQSRTTKVNAPMPGLIKSILVAEGDVVRKGATLFTLEAMKMENAITAPMDGIVRSVAAVESTAVEKGSVLCMLEPTAETP